MVGESNDSTLATPDVATVRSSELLPFTSIPPILFYNYISFEVINVDVFQECPQKFCMNSMYALV
jgi:hypothetical protein